MFSYKLNQVIFLLIFHGYDCQRRIKDGIPVSQDKTYAVYLLKAQISTRYYEGWVCGGALVSPEYIVTSAACVTDVTHLYAIAGLNTYVNETELYNNPCTKEKKKKIVFICTPKDYQLVHTQPEIWANIDIAMAKVESPYDFSDASYTQVCSYTPTYIEINFDPKHQEPGVDAIVLGWGHRTSYREEMDLANYNSPMLNYAPILIEDKEECKREYEVYPGMGEVIDQYMICTFNKGNLNDAGGTILLAAPTAQGCLPQQKRLRGEPSCENAGFPEDQVVLVENARKDITPTNFSRNGADQKSKLNSKINSNVVVSYNTHNSSLINKINKTVLHSRRSNTRRNGICQNDHGGPLVTWVGAHEKLIGVASAYKISETRECIGPYLFTSTQCNGAFLDCILRGDPSSNAGRRDICRNLLKEQGFQLVEKHISWKNHPDGPAENERNGTAPVSAVNTNTNNVTVKLMTSKEEINKTYQEDNAIKFDNFTNTNYTTTTHSIVHTNLTKTTKAVNVGDNSTPMNLININSTNLKKNASVNLTSGNSTNLINKTYQEDNAIKFDNFTNTNYTTTTHSIVHTNLTKTTKAVNVGDNSTPMNLININSTNLKKIASVNLTSGNSTNLINKTYQEHNATKFDNVTNTNYTITTHSIIDTNLTKTTKAVNVGDNSTPMNLININSTNIKKSASVNLTSIQ